MEFKRGDLRIGIKETIRHEALKSDIHISDREEPSDMDLLKYVASTGRTDWFEFLISSCDFLDSNGKFKPENHFNLQFALLHAINSNSVDIAKSIFSRATRKFNHLDFDYQLFQAMMKTQYDMAELLFENGARIVSGYKLRQLLKKADERMLQIMDRYKKNIVEL